MMSIDGKILALCVIAIAGGCIAGYIAFSKDVPGTPTSAPQQLSNARDNLWRDFGSGEEIAQTDPSQGADLTLSPEATSNENDIDAIAAQIADVEPAAGGEADQGSSCSFDNYINKEMDQPTIEALSRQGRPYRILAPGSIYTQDDSPARINFNIDEKNVILDVWCG